jgi:hypothetical protein
MSVQVQERAVVAEQTEAGAVATAAPPQEARTPVGHPVAGTVGRWERAWLWVALVVLFGAVVFGAMYVLTMLAGGPGYPY